MVQGEVNTAAMSPSIPSPNSNNTNANANAARVYENNTNTNANNNNNTLNSNNNDGEKKKKVGNYIISKTIGEGSFAKVRLGYHLITQQMVNKKINSNFYIFFQVYLFT
jgi:hypothetical protein